MKTIILIPYRNREEHLKYFLENTAPKLKEKIENLEILIIEQSEDGKRFNRGKILNVGFDYYNDDEYYYVTQDVDTNPSVSTMNYYKSIVPNNKILSIFSRHNFSLGGIIKMNGETFKKSNGFRNDIWGWGLEDRDFCYRTRNRNIKTIRINKKKVKFELLPHFKFTLKSKINTGLRKKVNKIFNSKNTENIQNFINDSGLNNLDYEILEECIINDYIKKIKVNINL